MALPDLGRSFNFLGRLHHCGGVGLAMSLGTAAADGFAPTHLPRKPASRVGLLVHHGGAWPAQVQLCILVEQLHTGWALPIVCPCPDGGHRDL